MKSKGDAHPPRLARRLLEWYCENAPIEDLQGDVDELFYTNLERLPAWKVKLRYWQQVISLMFSYAIKKRKEKSSYHPYSTNAMNFSMIINYFKIALRAMQKNKQYSLIKISGLAVGISACLVVYLIASYEMGFDKFHLGGERVFRIYSKFSGLLEGLNPGVSAAVPETVRNEFTGLEAVTGFRTYTAKVKINGERNSVFDDQKKIIIAGPEYFNVIQDCQWIAGSPKVLNNPFVTVLTESQAHLYFGGGTVERFVGREVIYHDSLVTTVGGILKDTHHLTDFDFTDYISFPTLTKSWLNNSLGSIDDWNSTNSSSQCLIRLDGKTTLQKIQSQVAILNKKYKEHNAGARWRCNYQLQPLNDIHFNTELGIFDHSRDPAHRPTLQTLIAVSVILLLVAIINFINIETAKAINRAKEVAIRKVIGSTRLNLILHLLCDGVLLTFFAVLLAIPISYFTMEFFSEFFSQGPKLDLANPSLYIFFGAILIVVSFLAGLYPAILVSSYQPVKALKNLSSGSRSHSALLRKSLIVFQFAVSQVLIIGMVITIWQINFMLNKDLGFKHNEILTFHIPWNEKPAKGEILKNELEKISGITAVCRQGSAPATKGYSTQTVEHYSPHGKEFINVHQKYGDGSYIPFYGMTFLAGRNVQPVDSIKELVINDTFRKKLGFAKPADAIGIVLNKGGMPFAVSGVISDFNFQSLHHAIEPISIEFRNISYSFAIKFASANPAFDRKATLQQISDVWAKIFPDEKIEYSFLDDNIRALYETEQKTSKLASVATSLAIFISCLGLFGLASFTAFQRTKEIGIRKVLGASGRTIVLLLSKEFIFPVLFGFAIASPLAYCLTQLWLQKFAYHINLNGWVFLGSMLVSLLVTFITVGHKSLQVASANPVDSLRYE